MLMDLSGIVHLSVVTQICTLLLLQFTVISSLVLRLLDSVIRWRGGGGKADLWVSSQTFFFKLTDLMISLALNFRTKVFVIVFLSLHLKSREELPGRGGSIFLLP